MEKEQTKIIIPKDGNTLIDPSNFIGMSPKPQISDDGNTALITNIRGEVVDTFTIPRFDIYDPTSLMNLGADQLNEVGAIVESATSIKDTFFENAQNALNLSTGVKSFDLETAEEAKEKQEKKNFAIKIWEKGKSFITRQPSEDGYVTPQQQLAEYYESLNVKAKTLYEASKALWEDGQATAKVNEELGKKLVELYALGKVAKEDVEKIKEEIAALPDSRQKVIYEKRLGIAATAVSYIWNAIANLENNILANEEKMAAEEHLIIQITFQAKDVLPSLKSNAYTVAGVQAVKQIADGVNTFSETAALAYTEGGEILLGLADSIKKSVSNSKNELEAAAKVREKVKEVDKMFLDITKQMIEISQKNTEEAEKMIEATRVVGNNFNMLKGSVNSTYEDVPRLIKK